VHSAGLISKSFTDVTLLQTERKKNKREKTRKTVMKTKKKLRHMQTTSNGTEHRLDIRVRDWPGRLTAKNGAELYFEILRLVFDPDHPVKRDLRS